MPTSPFSIVPRFQTGNPVLADQIYSPIILFRLVINHDGRSPRPIIALSLPVRPAVTPRTFLSSKTEPSEHRSFALPSLIFLSLPGTTRTLTSDRYVRECCQCCGGSDFGRERMSVQRRRRGEGNVRCGTPSRILYVRRRSTNPEYRAANQSRGDCSAGIRTTWLRRLSIAGSPRSC